MQPPGVIDALYRLHTESCPFRSEPPGQPLRLGDLSFSALVSAADEQRFASDPGGLRGGWKTAAGAIWCG